MARHRSQSITSLAGVGPAVAEKLGRLGIYTVNDLLWHVPRTWIDLTNPTPISRLRRDEIGVVQATVQNAHVEKTRRRRFSVLKAELADEAGRVMNAVWFNQPFLANQLTNGSQWLFWGKVSFDFQARLLSFANPKFTKDPTILAVYPETEGVTSAQLRRLLGLVLVDADLPEYLPESVRHDDGYPTRIESLRTLHTPKTAIAIQSARNRLALDELVRLITVLRRRRLVREAERSPSIAQATAELERFITSLPFTLTDGQRAAIQDSVNDLKKPTPMNRLIIGDVGSGKTVVALAAALVTVRSGYQVTWLAPTQILAEQHAATARKLLANTNIDPTLITAETPKDQRTGQLLIGTHALLSDSVDVSKLGLVIVDEQHRFGVEQRNHLLRKNAEGSQPHYLAMTATPIPRSLALTIFADADCSFLGMVPSGRKPVATRVVPSSSRDAALDVVLSELRSGRQAFVICPAIISSEHEGQLQLSDDKKAVTERYNALANDPRFRNVTVGLLHGKMKAEEKRRIMEEFAKNSIQLLVATSLVEVGIDVPNATVMVIESADQFGLAQLHQLRGRIGRGNKQSLCMVIPTDPAGENTRLETFASTTDGFALAELDLAERGPGDLLGEVQAGLPPLKLANLNDRVLLAKAQKVSEKLAELVQTDMVFAEQFQNFLEEYESNAQLD